MIRYYLCWKKGWSMRTAISRCETVQHGFPVISHPSGQNDLLPIDCRKYHTRILPQGIFHDGKPGDPECRDPAGRIRKPDSGTIGVPGNCRNSYRRSVFLLFCFSGCGPWRGCTVSRGNICRPASPLPPDDTMLPELPPLSMLRR